METLIKSLIKNKKPIIFDVGANNGDVTLKYKKIFPESIIWAFEPDPETFENLQKNTINNKDIYKVNCALGRVKSKLDFFQNKNPATNSLLRPAIRGMDWTDHKNDLEYHNQIHVNVDCIDGYCHENNINNIDLLKIDVQGAEYDVLNGASNMLLKKAIKTIYFESIFVDIYQNQSDLFECGLMLKKAGYRFLGLYDQIYDSTGASKWGEALFSV